MFTEILTENPIAVIRHCTVMIGSAMLLSSINPINCHKVCFHQLEAIQCFLNVAGDDPVCLLADVSAGVFIVLCSL